MKKSCHLSVDLLCQEMRDVCKGELRVSGLSLCSECQRALWWNGHSKAAFSPWTGCDNKRKNLVRDMKEQERVRRALLSGAGWPVCFDFLE